ncbi:hypothetical protein EYC80_002406 [Monilinia laxa]|uniref:Uncharacterized protein n=1 Tax=Monilinia laxa TaxID=61186 RepID=A0A5N6K3R2_MONLA|nr:hypothetical protein EYC80_002406 [Monilinia laxa]
MNTWNVVASCCVGKSTGLTKYKANKYNPAKPSKAMERASTSNPKFLVGVYRAISHRSAYKLPLAHDTYILRAINPGSQTAGERGCGKCVRVKVPK